MNSQEQINNLLQQISDMTPTSKYTVQVVFDAPPVLSYSVSNRFFANLMKKYVEARKPGARVFIWKNY